LHKYTFKKLFIKIFSELSLEMKVSTVQTSPPTPSPKERGLKTLNHKGFYEI